MLGIWGGDKNSQRYLKAIIESPLRLGASLQHALFNAPPNVHLHIGEAHSAEKYRGKATTEITRELRTKVYCLAGENPIAIRFKNM